MHTDLKSNHRHKARTLSGEPVSTWNVDATNAGRNGQRKPSTNDYALAKHELGQPEDAAQLAIEQRNATKRKQIATAKRVENLQSLGYNQKQIKEILSR
ncbi:hypothetical protein ACPV47_08550 [Vibrio jasicida]|uniref:hypothetical protein n=1 Tax=Vibrio jasicida TaxID=766224 RepID=UPI004067BECD